MTHDNGIPQYFTRVHRHSGLLYGVCGSEVRACNPETGDWVKSLFTPEEIFKDELYFADAVVGRFRNRNIIGMKVKK